jgi:peptidylprolyl isomerase
MALAACDGGSVEVTEASHPDGEHSEHAVEFTPGEPVDLGDGLICEQLTAGHGPAADAGCEVTLHYSSYLAADWDEQDEPQPFDSSTSRHVPLKLHLGRGPKVIEGLARGLVGLRAGSEAVLHVPAELGWGTEGNAASGVPADADLVYEVRVIEVHE